MNSAKYIEIFKNGQKEGIRDVTVKRKLQTVRKFLSYLEDAQTDDLQNIDRKNVYEFVNSLDYRSQTISGVQFTLRQFFNIMYEQRLSSFDGYQLFPMITTDKRDSILSYYSPEEIKILVESIDTAKKCGIRDKCMILAPYVCMQRPGSDDKRRKRPLLRFAISECIPWAYGYNKYRNISQAYHGKV